MLPPRVRARPDLSLGSEHAARIVRLGGSARCGFRLLSVGSEAKDIETPPISNRRLRLKWYRSPVCSRESASKLSGHLDISIHTVAEHS